MSMLSNLEFMADHGKPGLVCLVGGTSAIDRGIRKAQRRITPDGKPSLWSHAFIFQGERADGRMWLFESDIDICHGQVRNGVQEHRIDKYGDAKDYPNVAVLDFGLDASAVDKLVRAGLDFISKSTKYAFGGILRTYVAMMTKKLDRAAEKDEIFCSAFVRSLVQHAGIDIVPAVAVHHTTPEHLAQTTVTHKRYELVRQD